MGIRVAPGGSAPREAGGGRGGDRGESVMQGLASGRDRARKKVEKFRNLRVSSSFGFTRRAGFVRLAQPLGFVRLRGDSNSRRTSGRPKARRWEFYPISAALTTTI
jgi:hypothetical protein